MKTIRTISNISYNTPAHFRAIVERLAERGVIDWCYWIYHEPDTDETKPHTHFVLKPSARVDTTALREEFFEFEAGHTKPLAPTTKWAYTNSLDDWLLYAVHDIGYLTSKGQRRNVQYCFEDIQSTDEDALRVDWCAIDRTKYDRLRWLSDAVKNRIPFAVLVQQGLIPIAQRAQYEFQYKDLVRLELEDASGRIFDHESEV